MKRKIMKKLTVVLSAVTVLSLTGCGGDAVTDNQGISTDGQKILTDDEILTTQADITPMSTTTGENPVSDYPVTFTMMYSGQYNPNFKALAKMTELTNVTLDITAIPDSDYDTRNQLIINTGEDMPDLISKTNPKAAQALSGVLLPISDYYDQMPNFMKFIEENNLQYLIDNARQTDGKVYSLPVNVKEVKTSSKQTFIRKDVFEENNIPIPKTYDDLYEAAKKLKDIYPDSYPVSVVYGNGNLLDMVAPSFGTSAGWNKGPDGFHYVEEKDEWIFAPASEEYKVMLEYLHKLYAEQLFNQEYTTFSNDMYVQQASTDGAFILMADWLAEELKYNKALQDAGDENAEWVPIYPLEGPAGAYLSRMGNASQSMVIAASAAEKEYFPQLIKWLDWMYSEEAADLFSWGIEGETYTVDESGNKAYMPNVETPANPSGDWKFQDIADEYGVRNNCLTFVYPYDEEMARMNVSYLELIQQETDGDAIPNAEPSIALTEDETDTQALYSTNLNDYVDQMTTKFIMGSESFDNWEAYAAECGNKGANQLHELYNNAWKNMQN